MNQVGSLPQPAPLPTPDAWGYAESAAAEPQLRPPPHEKPIPSGETLTALVVREPASERPGFGEQMINAVYDFADRSYSAVATRLSQVPTVASMFADWITGSGPAHREFGPGTAETEDMMDAWRVNEARESFYKKNQGVPCTNWDSLTNYKGAFGLEGLLRAGVDPTEQFVGSYRIDIYPQPDCSLEWKLSNNTSMQSFLYGIGPDYERSSFRFGGNMTQTYTWMEPGRVETK